VRHVRFAGAGFNAEIAAIVNHRYFVKGLRQEHARAWTQLREKDINPDVRHVSAPVEWHADKDGWIILGFTCHARPARRLPARQPRQPRPAADRRDNRENPPGPGRP
jgi:hypothetical protein